jgi:16S rRNA G527 N7-methylase RsmG
MQPIAGPEDFAAVFGAPPETIERLRLYERLLRQWQKAVNLVAPATLDAVWHRHFADSAQLVPLAPPGTRAWIDLGSGAGFPGLVAAIIMAGRGSISGKAQAATSPPPSRRRRALNMWGRDRACPGLDPGVGEIPEHQRSGFPPPHKGEGNPVVPVEREAGSSEPGGERGPVASGEREPPRFTLIESDARKCAFLREVARQVAIPVDILSKRAESVRTSVNEALPRVVSARALAPLDRLFGLAAPLSPPGTTLLFLKGREVGKELQMAGSRWQFQVALVPSVTDTHGRVAVITNLERKAKD